MTESRDKLIEVAIRSVRLDWEIQNAIHQACISMLVFSLNTVGTDSLESPVAQRYTQLLAERDELHRTADALIAELRGLLSHNQTPANAILPLTNDAVI